MSESNEGTIKVTTRLYECDMCDRKVSVELKPGGETTLPPGWTNNVKLLRCDPLCLCNECSSSFS